ncbi:MAG TPA: DUF3783 domain-containing protein [Desulfosarcina sp.]|nr:DUF3783 domain-containing protein [Desulfosarcina sp.]
MTDGTFEKVQHSDTPLYGPPKLLLCGFPAHTQTTFKSLMKAVGLLDTAVVWAHEDCADVPLRRLLEQPDGTGADRDSALPRAIIVSGITENQLHGLMGACRQSRMKPSLWAVLTPTSENWTLSSLLDELQAERNAFARRGS